MKELDKLDPTRKLYIVIIFVVLFMIGLIVGQKFFNANSKNEMIESPTENANKSMTYVSFSPSSATIEVGKEKKVSVMLLDGEIQAADIVFTIPSSVEIADIKPGKNFPILLNQQIKDGKASVSVSLSPDTSKKTASGELFSFTLKALALDANAQLMFDKNETVAAKDGKNVLGTLKDATYIIK